MGQKYYCENGCIDGVVLINNCGIAHTLICPECNNELSFEENISTEWVGHEDPDNDYQIEESER